jgi:hypothetical protein
LKKNKEPFTVRHGRLLIITGILAFWLITTLLVRNFMTATKLADLSLIMFLWFIIPLYASINLIILLIRSRNNQKPK